MGLTQRLFLYIYFFKLLLLLLKHETYDAALEKTCASVETGVPQQKKSDIVQSSMTTVIQILRNLFK